jgi:soluble lytic murein transglycosylase-like protein
MDFAIAGGFALIVLYALAKTRQDLHKKQAQVIYSIDTIQMKYQALTMALAKRFSIKQCTIIAVIAVESGGDENAEGSIGERGLMQLTPTALEDVNNLYNLGLTWDDMYIPERNITAGAAYLAILKWRYLADRGNEDKAIQAYNYGASRVNRNPDAGLEYLAKVNEFKDLII